MQSGTVFAGRMIVGRRPEELLVVLGVVGIVQVAEDVVDFAAGHFAVGSGAGFAIRQAGVAVAIEWNGLSAGLMEAGHCEIVVALAIFVTAVNLDLVEICMSRGHTQCPSMAVVGGSCSSTLEAEEILRLHLMSSASLGWTDDVIGLVPPRWRLFDRCRERPSSKRNVQVIWGLLAQ